MITKKILCDSEIPKTSQLLTLMSNPDQHQNFAEMIILIPQEKQMGYKKLFNEFKTIIEGTLIEYRFEMSK